MARPHAPRTEKVVGIGFQPGFDPYKVNTTTSYIAMFYIFIVEATMVFCSCLGLLLLKLYNSPFCTIYLWYHRL
jgi:hypothetical protein